MSNLIIWLGETYNEQRKIQIPRVNREIYNFPNFLISKAYVKSEYVYQLELSIPLLFFHTLFIKIFYKSSLLLGIL